MADIKTILRETSVIIGFIDLINEKEHSFDIHNYRNKIILTQDQKLVNESSSIFVLQEFSDEHISILKNGYKLANVIIEQFQIKTYEEVIWYGFDSHKENPADISINGHLFSLKEDSFILENMGLYKMVNLLTNSNFYKLHIFEDYSPKEYREWFDTTWYILVEFIKKNKVWRSFDANKDKEAIIYSKGEKVVFQYRINDYSEVVSLNFNTTLDDFQIKTTSKIRENVFSKWINKVISSNESYLIKKKICAEVAARNLKKYLLENLNYKEGIARLLRLHEQEYYYAKVDNLNVEIYKVPSKNNFSNNIVIDSIYESVPLSQVNIITRIRNIKTNQLLILRNECRFSHGQFNGTPEAKMYYDSGNALLAIYDKLI